MNAYLKKLQDRERAAYSVGEDWGRAIEWDALQIVLHQEYGWGKERLKRLNDLVGRQYQEVRYGLEKHADADVTRYKVDEIMKEIYGDEANDWSKRYEGWEETDIMKERHWK